MTKQNDNRRKKSLIYFYKNACRVKKNCIFARFKYYIYKNAKCKKVK